MKSLYLIHILPYDSWFSILKSFIPTYAWMRALAYLILDRDTTLSVDAGDGNEWLFLLYFRVAYTLNW